MLADTALSLGADTDSPGPTLLGTDGSLLCTAAQHDHRSRALKPIGEAEETARRLDGATPSHTAFSRIEIPRLPTTERQARFALHAAEHLVTG